MAWWDTIAADVSTAAGAYADPDGWFFPKIASAATKDQAFQFLNTWKTVKTTKFTQEGKTPQEIINIDTIYNSKLAEINARFSGQVGATNTLGLSPQIITVVVAGLILYFAYKHFKKGKK